MRDPIRDLFDQAGETPQPEAFSAADLGVAALSAARSAGMLALRLRELLEEVAPLLDPELTERAGRLHAAALLIEEAHPLRAVIESSDVSVVVQRR